MAFNTATKLHVMLFRLANDPVVFQRCVCFCVYMSPLCFCQTLQKHVLHLRAILQHLLQSQVCVEAEKCEFNVTSVSLGFCSLCMRQPNGLWTHQGSAELTRPAVKRLFTQTVAFKPHTGSLGSSSIEQFNFKIRIQWQMFSIKVTEWSPAARCVFSVVQFICQLIVLIKIIIV